MKLTKLNSLISLIHLLRLNKLISLINLICLTRPTNLIGRINLLRLIRRPSLIHKPLAMLYFVVLVRGGALTHTLRHRGGGAAPEGRAG